MQKPRDGRVLGHTSNDEQETDAELGWRRLLDDKVKAAQLGLASSSSVVEPHRLLMLVDLQGMYLAFHEWLSDCGVPIDDGFIISKFVHLQIERAAQEVADRVARSRPRTMDLRRLVDSIEVTYIDGRPCLGKKLDVLKDGTYLDISMKFEMFYAPVLLEEMEWRLRKAASRGSAKASTQLQQIRSGVVAREGIFKRNYRAYDDFVLQLKNSIFHARTHEGFFGYYVGQHGLSYFDEKEVDIRIAIRAMDALYAHEVDTICIVSSDQDYMPLHARADDFGITSYQADLSHFLQSDRIGAKFRELGVRFIRGGVDPAWPLEILTRAISAPGLGHYAEYKVSESELRALCKLHNELNDWNINVEVGPDGAATIKMHRPR